ncbi:MAG: hypothetical protein ACEQSA_01570 [Weeksellaceae bacterium]
MVKKKRNRNLRQLLQLSVIGVLASLIGIVSFSNLNEKRLVSQAYVENNTEIGALTNTLVSQLEEYNSLNQPFGDKTKKRLVQSNINKLALQRYQAIKTAAQAKDETILETISLSSIRNSFPASTKRYIESNIKKKSKLQTLHVHGHQAQTELNGYKYSLQDTQKTKLIFADSDPFISSDSLVEVQGYSFTADNSLILTSTPQEKTGILAQQYSVPKTTGTRNHVITLIEFGSSEYEETLPDNEKQRLISFTENVLNNYYKENSFDQLDFNISDFRIITLPQEYNTDSDDSTICLKNNQRIHDYLINRLNTNSDGYIYLLPGECTYATDDKVGKASGWGSIGGQPAVSWIHFGDDTFLLSSLTESLGPVYHEIGHNLGLWHAGYMQCNGSIANNNTYITNNPFCENIVDYGDTQDVMGIAVSKTHFNAPHKNQLGWISSNNVADAKNLSVDNPQRFEIAPIETQNQDRSLKQMIVVNLPSNPDYYYYISYRRPIGFDKNIPASIVNGASIHIINEAQMDTSLLIHPRLGVNSNTTAETAAMVDGESYIDTLNNIRIRQVSHSDTSVIVEISAVTQLSTTPTKSPTTPTVTPTPVLIVNPELGGTACRSGEWVCNSQAKCANFAIQTLFNTYWCNGEAQWKWEAADNSNSCGGALSKPRTQGC